MLAGSLIALAGLCVAPLWDRLLGGSLTIPYLLGLAVTAAGAAWLARDVARSVRARTDSARRDARRGLALLAIAGLYLSLELAATAVILGGGFKADLFDFRNRQLARIDAQKIAHPFLIITNNPIMPGVNALGFLGENRPAAKPPGVIRVACIGGSTTADGYPTKLQEALGARWPAAGIEVLNFGNAGWTTAQNVINYALNVKHFDPDIAILHMGANDYKARGYSNFRTDFAHAFTPLRDPPRRWDRYLLTYTNAWPLLKWARFRQTGRQAGSSVYELIQQPNLAPGPMTGAEIDVTLSNIEDLIALAESRGTRVLLTTQPYSRADMAWGEGFPMHVEQVNGRVRALAAERGLPLADLGAAIDGDGPNFIDPVHLTEDSIARKTEILAEALQPIIRELVSGPASAATRSK